MEAKIMPDTTLNLTQPHGGEGPEPYTIDITGAEPDDCYVLAVTVDDEQAERWGRVQQQWFDVQDEMERAFKAAKKVVADREAAEEAEARRLDAIEAAKEKTERDAQEVALDEQHGPREWAIVTKSVHNRRMGTHERQRRVHSITCSSFKQVEGHRYSSGYQGTTVESIVRKPEAIAALGPLQEYGFRSVTTRACQRCAGAIEDAALAAAEAKEQVEHEKFMNRADAPDFM